MRKIDLCFTILCVIFCVCFVIDSFLELKVFSIFGVPITAGFFVIPISYIVNDCITEIYGYRRTLNAMVITFLMHLAVVLIFFIACKIPGNGWEGEEHFQFIFGLTPRITFASIMAFIVGTTINSCIMEKMKAIDGCYKFKKRAFISTVFGEFFDSFTFFFLAFLGIFSIPDILFLIISQSIVKIICEAIVLPITERVVHFIEFVAEY